MNDALANYTPKNTGNFLRIEGGSSVKLRVLTLDPGVVESSGVNASGEPWARTQFAFIVWNWDEGRAMIWTTTQGNLNKLTNIHRDEDLEPLNKTDIKVSATGEMLEKRYEIIPLPKAGEITKAMVDEAGTLKIEDLNGYKGRLSELMESDDDVTVGGSGYEQAKATARKIDGKQDEVVDVDPDETINLDDIPF